MITDQIGKDYWEGRVTEQEEKRDGGEVRVGKEVEKKRKGSI